MGLKSANGDIETLLNWLNVRFPRLLLKYSKEVEL